MDFENAHEHADALAIAPYFGGPLGSPDTQWEVANWSVDQALAAAGTHMDEMLAHASQSATDTADRGLVLIAYEAGQHLVAYGNAVNNQALTDLFIAANRAPGMGDLYTTYFDKWMATGGQMMVMFNYVDHPTQWGSWGLLEYQDQSADEAHKYASTIQFMQEQAPWW